MHKKGWKAKLRGKKPEYGVKSQQIITAFWKIQAAARQSFLSKLSAIALTFHYICTILAKPML